MDVCVMDYTNSGREKCLAPQSSDGVHALRHPELDNTGEEQELGKCHHFSIRGYVSEIRKSNKEICWPFCTVGDRYKLEQHEDFLPPMTVPDFKWWGCKSCLHKAHFTQPLTGNGTDNHARKSENTRHDDNATSFYGNPVVRHTHALGIISDFQINCEDTLIGAKSGGQDSFVNRRDGYHQPSVSHCKKDNVPKSAGIHGNDLLSLTNSKHCGQSSQNPFSDIASYKGNSFDNVRKQEPEIRKDVYSSEAQKTGGIISECGTASPSGSKANVLENVLQPAVQSERIMLQDENVHNIMNKELEENKQGSKVSETQLNARILTVVNVPEAFYTPTDDPRPRMRDMPAIGEEALQRLSPAQAANSYVAVGPEGSSNTDSNGNDNSLESQEDGQFHLGESDISNASIHRRKARKVRMLNDIIKSEVLGLSRQCNLSTGKSAIKCGDYGKIEAANAKVEMLPPDSIVDVSEEREREAFKNKKRKVLSESEDEGPSLIHWLRRVPKKIKAQKCDEHASHGIGLGIPQSLTYASTGKCVQSETRVFGTAKDMIDRNLEIKVPRNIIPQVMCQQAMQDNEHSLADGETAKCINIGKPVSRLAINHRSGHSEEQLGGSCDEIFTHNTTCSFKHELGVKDPSCASEYEHPDTHKGSQHVLKKSGAKGKEVIMVAAAVSAPLAHEVTALHSNQTKDKQISLHVRERIDGTSVRKRMVTSSVSEKQVDSPANEKQAVLDGIPIEILELLQSNYHKNHRLSSGRYTVRSVDTPELSGGSFASRMVETSEANGIRRDCSLGKLSNIAGSGPVPHSQHRTNLDMCSRSMNTGVGVYAVTKSTGQSNMDLKTQTSHYSGRGRRQMKKEGQHPAAFDDLSDVHLCLAPPRTGIQPPAAESYLSYCSPNYNWDRFQNVESQYNALGMSREQPCRCFPHGAVQTNSPQKIQSSIYNSGLFSPTILLERNPMKTTQSSYGLRLADTNLNRHHKIRQKNDGRTRRTIPTGNACTETGKLGKECSSKVSQSLDLYTNDSISAMHLLRLMDPAVGSASSSLCLAESNDRSEYLNKFKYCGNDYRKNPFDTDLNMRNKFIFNDLGSSGHRICTQANSSDLMSPMFRYGGQESFSQKRVLSGSSNFGALPEFNGTDPGEIGYSLKTGRKEKRKGSYLATQSKLREQMSLCRYGHLEDQLQLTLTSAGYSRVSEPRESMIQFGCKNSDEATLPIRTSHQTELCVVNRNPADFSAPDENNEYMISYKDLKPRYSSPKRNKQRYMDHPDAPRQQRLLKIAASKWNLRC